MASTEQQAEKVAQEKRWLSLRWGDTPARAERYAQEVREGAANRRAEEGGRH
jgi:hypothetical protein